MALNKDVFIALIVRTYMQNQLGEYMNMHKFTFQKILLELDKVKLIYSAREVRFRQSGGLSATSSQTGRSSILPLREQRKDANEPRHIVGTNATSLVPGLGTVISMAAILTGILIFCVGGVSI